ncbi:PREDICTED: NADPH oxidase 5 [Corvus brachyrhynchos]|uniref:NADPH oxidase 5 n=1 Tax=Corvus brachyrhynchos TaxID=85066 RepID=UPI0008167D58|nr:PREDICTED: NADPH oxidase 5 [Corvus brachyrhynchos]
MGAAADAEWLRWVTKQFGNIAGKDREISLEEFKSALQVKEVRDPWEEVRDPWEEGNGILGKRLGELDELLGSLPLLLHGNSMEKLRFLFRVYDVDGSGSIDAEELRVVLRECLRESSMALPEERLGALSQALLQAADRDHSGSITFPELREQLEAFPEILENLSISVRVGFLGFASDGTQGMGGMGISHCQRDIGKGFRREGDGFEVLSKPNPGDSRIPLGCLFPRGHPDSPTGKHPLAPALPIPVPIPIPIPVPIPQVFYWSHLSYISVWILLLLHGPHFWKWFLIPGSLFFLEKVLGWAWRRAGDLHILEANLLPSKVTHLVIQRPKSFHFQPGDYVFLNIPAIAAYEWHPFSISSAPEQPETLWLHIRALGQWTNKLYEYFQQLELRGPEPNPPGKSRRERRSRHWEQEGSQGGSVATGRDGAVELMAFRAPGAAFPGMDPEQGGSGPGQSCSVKVRRFRPFLDPGKWAGISIPGHPIHVPDHPIHVPTSHPRSHPCSHTQSMFPHAIHIPNPAIPSVPFSSVWELFQHWQLRDLSLSLDLSQCYLDGPYGTPSRRIFTSEHAVLIGAGIGITPFASILQSIMFRWVPRQHGSPSCHFSWSEERRDEEMTLRKVDFIWITRDQQHLEWFLSLLSKLETEQAELEPGGKFLELHLYLTSALGKGDVKALGLQVALDLLAAKENRDSITGLRTRTQPGRPDWAKVFGKVAAEQRGKVRVFFCGSPGLAGLIRGHCRTFGFRFSKENF